MIKKKVLFTSHTANFQKFNRPFMRWFSEQGWEVHYASMGEEGILDCDKSFVVPFKRNPISGNNIRAYKDLKAIIDREKYDIIHTHTPVGGVITRLAAQKSRKNGTRVFYTAHGFHFYKGAPIINWLLYYPIEKFAANYTDKLITINEEDYAIANNRFKTSVEYIPGVGVDQSKFNNYKVSKEYEQLRKSIGVTPEDILIIYPAELSKRKNQMELIRAISLAIRNNPHIHLLLPGGDSLKGGCQRSACKLNLSGNIHFLGYRDDISQLLLVSDVAISSSKQEGLPVNLMEALHAGLPILATNCRGNREMVIDGDNGYFISLKKHKDLELKLLSIIHNRNTSNSMSQSSTYMSSYYTQEKALKSFSKIYGEFI